MRKGFPLFAGIATAGLWFGCATPGPAPAGRQSNTVVDTKATDLEGLRPALHTLEDSLVLDLLLGYRQLSIQSGGSGTADRETSRHARSAYNQLEYLLRHGGVENRGQEGRVFTLPGGEKVTLGELVTQLSRVMLKSGVSGDWKASSERAKEIQRHKPDLSSLVEDAGWCLALADALESPLSEDVKRRLRILHESYGMEVAHDEIIKQVNSLLKDVQDERLRRELKKLANRSWERDKRAGIFKEPLATVRPDSTPAETTPPVAAPVTVNAPVKTDSAGMTVAPRAVGPDSGTKVAKDRVDSLVLKGQYLEALRVMESVDIGDSTWVRDHRQKIGERFCDERRSAAAASFSTAHKSADDSTRVRALRQSLAALDSCLFHFPDAPVAAKVRRNREMVEKELRH